MEVSSPSKDSFHRNRKEFSPCQLFQLIVNIVVKRLYLLSSDQEVTGFFVFCHAETSLPLKKTDAKDKYRLTAALQTEICMTTSISKTDLGSSEIPQAKPCDRFTEPDFLKGQMQKNQTAAGA